MRNHIDEMRLFIHECSLQKQQDVIIETQSLPVQNTDELLMEDLESVLVKMKTYQENSSDQSYAMGVEVGLSMACELLENILKHHLDGRL